MRDSYLWTCKLEFSQLGFKDSVGGVTIIMTCDEVTGYLELAEKQRADFGFIVDLR